MKNLLRIACILGIAGMVNAQAANITTSRSNTQHNITAVAKCQDEKGKPCTDDHGRG